VSCKYNLYLDVKPSGAVLINFPDREVSDMTESCALDVAERGVTKLIEIGAMMNITRERIRQVEAIAVRKLERNKLLRSLRGPL
jgi:DNA-directed RNA polymerase sigma subunit (sigma70/sigma32)